MIVGECFVEGGTKYQGLRVVKEKMNSNTGGFGLTVVNERVVLLV